MALDRTTVIRAALALLDEVGLDGLTLRRLAADLDVKAPALYWHFKNKQELLDEMATTVLSDAVSSFTSASPLPWDEWMTVYGSGMRAMLLKHRDGAKMFSGTYLTDNSLYAPMESALRTLTGAGFTPQDAIAALMTVYCFVVGFAIEEQAAVGDPRYETAQRNARIDATEMPLTREFSFTDFDGRFDYGLRAIIRGVTPSSTPPAGRTSAARRSPA